MQTLNKLVLLLSVATGITAQVTETVTPNSQEFAQIKSDFVSYHSALTTQAAWLAAASYLQEHSTSVPAIGVQLHTSNWAEGVSALNALITTSYPAAFPTAVAALYQSALSMQANIINQDITQEDSIAVPTQAPAANGLVQNNNATASGTSAPLATAVYPSTNSSATYSGVPAASTSSPAKGAANAQIVVSGAMMVVGLGAAMLL